MSEAVIVYLWGGLGNQLFQYTAGLAIREAAGQERPSLFLLPAKDNGHSARDYRRDLMPLGLPVEAPAEHTADAIAWPKDGFAPWSPAALVGRLRAAGARRVLVRGYYQYLPAIIQQVPQVRADLLDSLAELRDRMALKYRIQDPRAVASLHVRRGDYVKLQAEGFHLLGPEYYRPAVQAVQGSLGAPTKWLIFSNDPAWCRTQNWLPPGAEVVDESDELATLALLSLCQAAAVTSNSTFSWWGAVLANPVIVTYSTRWIGNTKPTLFPATWMRIDS